MAIVVGLGGAATLTKRGQSVKSFIKEGCRLDIPIKLLYPPENRTFFLNTFVLRKFMVSMFAFTFHVVTPDM